MLLSLKLRIVSVTLVVTALLSPSLRAQTVDATTMNNKVMAGYQGWFRAPGDARGNRGWAHQFNGPVSPEKLAFDTWPDMSELTASEKYAVPGFTYPDGSQAYLYSAQNYKTVLRHFQWMKEYGIDGVWLSEFCGYFPGGKGERDSLTVLTIMHNVQRAAASTGRTWAFMWDMSSFNNANTTKNDVYTIMVNQWKKMVDEGVTTDPRYLHHNGKPVLLIWGFFPDRATSQPDYMSPVLDFLLAQGKYQATVVGGVDNTWRSKGTPEFQSMLMRMQGLQPWSVGRRRKDPATGYAVQNTTEWAGDMEKCKANHVMFMPVFNPGTHIAGPPPTPPAGPIVPRRTGNYLWEQFVAASKTGTITSAFVAMFDEVNEGTQIMKIENHPPVQAPFLTYDGATSDYYLRLVGTGARMLREHQPITPIIPISPFDPQKDYRIKNRATGLMLAANGKVILQTEEVAGAGLNWQLSYDGKGFFEIKTRGAGTLLGTRPEGDTIIQSSDLDSDSVKWHLEWDGTGYCRIINKANGKAIRASAQGALEAVPDEHRDDLRWKILPQ